MLTDFFHVISGSFAVMVRVDMLEQLDDRPGHEQRPVRYGFVVIRNHYDRLSFASIRRLVDGAPEGSQSESNVNGSRTMHQLVSWRPSIANMILSLII